MSAFRLIVVVVDKSFVIGEAQFKGNKNANERYAIGGKTIKGNSIRNFKPLALYNSFHVLK